MTNNNPTFVVTGKVRLSYVHLFKPHASVAGAEEKYSTTILLPKNDYATKQRIDMAIEAAKRQGISEKWNGVMPPVISIPIHDGDGVRPSDGMPFGAECKGHWVFTASSKQPPQIVDVNRNFIINQSEIFSGIYAIVSVNFFPYFNSGKKGIGCGLGNVMKLEDGEALGGRTSAEDDFANISQYYTGQPVQAQPAYAPQTQYPQTQPQYPQPQPAHAPQPQYSQPQPAYAPQPQYIQPAINPITGMPM